MSYNQLSTEKNATAAIIASQTINTAAGNVTSTAVNARDFEQIGARVNIGTVAAADVVVTILQGQGSGMTGAKTLLTTTVSTPSGKFVRMVARGQDFDVSNGFNYAQLQISHDDATGGPIGGELEGLDGPYQDSTSHAAAVTVVTPY